MQMTGFSSLVLVAMHARMGWEIYGYDIVRALAWLQGRVAELRFVGT
jgi:hypothetical protein